MQILPNFWSLILSNLKCLLSTVRSVKFRISGNSDIKILLILFVLWKELHINLSTFLANPLFNRSFLLSLSTIPDFAKIVEVDRANFGNGDFLAKSNASSISFSIEV